MLRSALPLVVISALLLTGPVRAGGVGETALAGESGESFRYTLLADCSVSSDDLSLGTTIRFALAQDVGLGSFVHFSMRPYHKTTSVKVGEHSRLQLQEQRYLLGVGFDEDLPLNSIAGIYVSGGAGYTFADYEATRRRPSEGWTALMGAGLSFHWIWDEEIEGVARIGYRYADLRRPERNWFCAAVGVRF